MFSLYSRIQLILSELNSIVSLDVVVFIDLRRICNERKVNLYVHQNPAMQWLFGLLFVVGSSAWNWLAQLPVDLPINESLRLHRFRDPLRH